MRSLSSRRASDTNRSGGIHGMSRWQSAEILRYCMVLPRAAKLAIGPTVLSERKDLLAIRAGAPQLFLPMRHDPDASLLHLPDWSLRLHAKYVIRDDLST